MCCKDKICHGLLNTKLCREIGDQYFLFSLESFKYKTQFILPVWIVWNQRLKSWHTPCRTAGNQMVLPKTWMPDGALVFSFTFLIFYLALVQTWFALPLFSPVEQKYLVILCMKITYFLLTLQRIIVKKFPWLSENVLEFELLGAVKTMGNGFWFMRELWPSGSQISNDMFEMGNNPRRLTCFLGVQLVAPRDL